MKSVTCPHCGREIDVAKSTRGALKDNPARLLRLVRDAKKLNPNATGIQIANAVGCKQPYVSRLLNFVEQIDRDVLRAWEKSCDAGDGVPINDMMKLAADAPKAQHAALYRRLCERKRIDRDRELQLRRLPRRRSR